MTTELGRCPSGRAAAANAVEPSSTVSSKADIPNADEVADALRWLGDRVSAVALCTILEIRGFGRAKAQLGMQRAFDCDEPTVRVNDDWTLSAIAMEARQRRDAEERPDPKDDSAGRRHRPDTPSLQTPQGGDS